MDLAVVVDGELYVRTYNGRSSRWFQSAVKQKAGKIYAGGMMKLVRFEIVSNQLNDKIDMAYKVKYKGSPYLEPMLNNRTKAATIKISPVV